MEKKEKKQLILGVGLVVAFAIWTWLIQKVDVQPVGQNGTDVGFATFNCWFHKLTGVHMELYILTDWLGLVPIGTALGFAVLGLVQLIQRKALRKVDRSILALGGFYLAVMAFYVLFEKAVVNYRPVLIEGVLEASYPSSTTMLALCVMPTAAMQLKARVRSGLARSVMLGMIAAFTAFLVFGRLLSGVHWLSDIVGGVLLSEGLVCAYAFAAE